jgi:hypothetical protein
MQIRDEGFEHFCRDEYEKMNFVCKYLGLINDESFECYKSRNLTRLISDYINSVDETIH